MLPRIAKTTRPANCSRGSRRLFISHRHFQPCQSSISHSRCPGASSHRNVYRSDKHLVDLDLPRTKSFFSQPRNLVQAYHSSTWRIWTSKTFLPPAECNTLRLIKLSLSSGNTLESYSHMEMGCLCHGMRNNATLIGEGR